MGERMEINTAMVEQTAQNIRKINNQIRDDFKDVVHAVRNLESHWNSRAKHAVIGRFYSVQNTYSNARYQVVDKFPDYLLKLVSDGYEITENTNTSLADAFK